MKDSPRRRKHRRRAFRRLFWLLVLATLLLLLWPRRLTLDGLNSPHAILLQADSGEVLAEKDAVPPPMCSSLRGNMATTLS